MRENTTTVIDALGLVFIACGVGLQVVGWFRLATRSGEGLTQVAYGSGLVAAGIVLIVGTWLSDRVLQSKNSDPDDRGV